MKTDQMPQNTADKFMLILKIAASVAVIILSLLHLLKICESTLDYAIPLMGIITFIEAIQMWKTHKLAAVINLCTAAFVFICTLLVWLL